MTHPGSKSFTCLTQKEPGTLLDLLPDPSPPPICLFPSRSYLELQSDLLQDTLALTHLLPALSGSGRSQVTKGRHVTCPIGFRAKARELSLASHNQLGHVSEKLRRPGQNSWFFEL